MAVRYGNFMFRYRNAVFPVVLIALFLAFRPQWPRGSERLDNLLDAGGVLVAMIGQLMRIAVIGYAYIVRGGRQGRVYAEGLVTEGFFAHSRNPLYLGNILVLLGLFLIHNNPWVYIIGLPFFVVGYMAIVAAEEAFLDGKFGAAYDAYRTTVPRWFPRLRGIRESVAGMRFNWRRVILREYGSTYAWMAGAIVLMIADTLAHVPYRERAAYINTLLGALGVLTIAYGTARYLKLSRRLKEVAA
jgi:protein-S-isoprenylcysteine O-methyltransferase Ste14